MSRSKVALIAAMSVLGIVGYVLWESIEPLKPANGQHPAPTAPREQAQELEPTGLERRDEPSDESARVPKDLEVAPEHPIEERPTMGSYLGEFWGEHWPEIEAELRTTGNAAMLDLEILPQDMPPPWEEVEPLLEKLLADRIEGERAQLPSRLGARRGGPWPEPPTKEFLAERARLGMQLQDIGDVALARALEDTRLLRMQIAERERDLVDAYHAACLGLLRGRSYGRSHFFYLPSIERALTSPEYAGRPRWNPTLVNHRGWTVVFQLYKEENAALEYMVDELRPMYDERDRGLKAVLSR